MRVFAHHDPDGTIRSVISVNAPEGITFMITPEPGVLVSELTGVKVKEGPDHIAALQKLAKSHKVTAPVPVGKATKKR